MVLNDTKSLHEDDWKNVKSDYDYLRKNKDISERMSLLMNFFKKNKLSKILDIGCGSGYLGYLLKQIDPKIQITGCDISENALKQANAYDKVYHMDIDKTDIPEKDNCFDMIVCTDVIEHIYDVDHCLREIKRVLKPDGKAIITTPNYSYWKYRIKTLLGCMPKILRDSRHLHVFTHDLLAKKCYNAELCTAYTINEKKGLAVKFCQSLFNKTIVFVLTREN